MNKILSLTRRCVEDYEMIQPGDQIAVGVSGGKDSLTLLAALAKLREFYPIPYTVEAFTLDMGHAEGRRGMNFSAVTRFCQELDVPYTIINSEIHHIIFDVRREKNPCSMCAKMRRGALHEAMLARGITKIALGHHYDDAIETFFMSLLFEGRLSCFQPVTFLDRTGITQIRPLLYCGESLIRHTARRLNLPVTENPCPANGNTQRQEIQGLSTELQGRYPGLKARTFGAMQRLPLPQWGPVEHRRRPLPEDLEEDVPSTLETCLESRYNILNYICQSSNGKEESP
ncbi:MAG: tRNA 2-thiocytidine biosynthesis TtcA family protein [Lawsonibacter sp.]|nr:tRNA 2-thiocytidine biosynthesis TtcA family protein [Lawsonibacter sp.]